LDADAYAYGSVVTDTFAVFQSEAAWGTFVRAHGGIPAPLVGVDWTKEIVLGAFAGQTATDPAAVRITRVALLRDQILVTVEVTRPLTVSEGTPTPAPASPHHLVTIARGDLPSRVTPTVVFLDAAGRPLAWQALNVAPAPQPTRPTRPGARARFR